MPCMVKWNNYLILFFWSIYFYSLLILLPQKNVFTSYSNHKKKRNEELVNYEFVGSKIQLTVIHCKTFHYFQHSYIILATHSSVWLYCKNVFNFPPPVSHPMLVIPVSNWFYNLFRFFSTCNFESVRSTTLLPVNRMGRHHLY